ncbi:hypothetical protein FUAX_19130 [Fulvitalea axinellae]|uniref:Carboxypeptidase-like regulatory domain-containing protein n=1 Tax=Fulvitalea axinellae TaxID=1182444 RepID=A0AAU9CKJ6_9BACT|nr:hypothetical protein FUAX_19130 [Fulvitalea axinellae]
MRNGLILFFLIFTISAKAQVLTGKIVDAKTLSPIPFVHIYIEGTHVGTASDAEGKFRLQAKLGDGIYHLVVSSVGYDKTKVAVDRNTSEDIIIPVKQNVVELRAITVRGGRRIGKAYLDLFKSKFIGNPDDSLTKNCELLNPEVLRFYYNKNDKRFEVWSEDSLRFLNRNLGYEMSVKLNEFHFDTERWFSFCRMDRSFKDLTEGMKRRECRKVLKRRNAVYEGTKAHFLDAVYKDKLWKKRYRIIFKADLNQVDSMYTYFDTLKHGPAIRTPYGEDVKNLHDSLSRWTVMELGLRGHNVTEMEADSLLKEGRYLDFTEQLWAVRMRKSDWKKYQYAMVNGLGYTGTSMGTLILTNPGNVPLRFGVDGNLERPDLLYGHRRNFTPMNRALPEDFGKGK